MLNDAMSKLIIMYQQYFGDQFLGATWDAEEQEYRFRYIMEIHEGGQIMVHYYTPQEIEEATCEN